MKEVELVSVLQEVHSKVRSAKSVAEVRKALEELVDYLLAEDSTRERTLEALKSHPKALTPEALRTLLVEQLWKETVKKSEEGDET